MNRSFVTVVAFILFLMPGIAAAQDPDLSPTFGLVELWAGAGEEVALDVAAPAATISLRDAGYVGFIAPEPTLALHYWGAGSLEITLSDVALDGVMLVLTPDGAWRFNDDAIGRDPALVLEDAESGRYLIWIGTWGGDPTPATLTVADRAAVDRGVSAGSAFPPDDAGIASFVAIDLPGEGWGQPRVTRGTGGDWWSERWVVEHPGRELAIATYVRFDDPAGPRQMIERFAREHGIDVIEFFTVSRYDGYLEQNVDLHLLRGLFDRSSFGGTAVLARAFFPDFTDIVTAVLWRGHPASPPWPEMEAILLPAP